LYLGGGAKWRKAQLKAKERRGVALAAKYISCISENGGSAQ
jgi:hypothetical protein